jgi:hypothetical protein
MAAARSKPAASGRTIELNEDEVMGLLTRREVPRRALPFLFRAPEKQDGCTLRARDLMDAKIEYRIEAPQDVLDTWATVDLSPEIVLEDKVKKEREFDELVARLARQAKGEEIGGPVEYKGRYRVRAAINSFGQQRVVELGRTELRYTVHVSVKVTGNTRPEPGLGSVLVTRGGEVVERLACPRDHFFEDASGDSFIWVERGDEFRGWLVRKPGKDVFTVTDDPPKLETQVQPDGPLNEGDIPSRLRNQQELDEFEDEWTRASRFALFHSQGSLKVHNHNQPRRSFPTRRGRPPRMKRRDNSFANQGAPSQSDSAADELEAPAPASAPPLPPLV